jgi:hypothetical protein
MTASSSENKIYPQSSQRFIPKDTLLINRDHTEIKPRRVGSRKRIAFSGKRGFRIHHLNKTGTRNLESEKQNS